MEFDIERLIKTAQAALKAHREARREAERAEFQGKKQAKEAEASKMRAQIMEWGLAIACYTVAKDCQLN